MRDDISEKEQLLIERVALALAHYGGEEVEERHRRLAIKLLGQKGGPLHEKGAKGDGVDVSTLIA
jgi:hypothetical protein